MISRIATVGALVVAMLATAMPGAAADERLADYLEKAEGATYSGRQIVVSFWQGEAHAEVFDVERLGPTAIVSADGGTSMVGHGKVTDVGGDGASLAIAGWSPVPLADRYVMREPVTVRRIGRVAEQIDVLEAGRLRARFVFDQSTYAPLSSAVFDADEHLFRFATLLDFETGVAANVPAEVPDAAYDVMLPAAVSGLPDLVAGYVKADAYVGPDDVAHAFYSDGLFSFSVFVFEEPVRLEAFDDAQTLDAEGRRYMVLVLPAEMWVRWTRGDTTYLLVGDLPPDHLEAVLAELPQPRSPSLWDRLWSGIFR